MGLGRPAVVLSIVFHVVGFFVIVGVPRLLASGPDPGKVYVVDLVTLPGPAGPGPATPAPPAAAAAPKPEPSKPAAAPKPPPVKKPTEKAIVLPDRNAMKAPQKPPPAKPKEKPPVKEDAAAKAAAAAAAAAVEAAAKEPAPTAPAAATASGDIPAGTPTVAGTGGGGEGDGTGGGGDAYTFYLALLKHNIESAWKRPVYTGDTTLSATVNLRLSRTGRVQKLELSRASGFEPLDRSLMVAVRAAEPFPPFPAALVMDTLAVQIVFDLTPEGSESGNPGD
jgi:TonB family protein